VLARATSDHKDFHGFRLTVGLAMTCTSWTPDGHLQRAQRPRGSDGGAKLCADLAVRHTTISLTSGRVTP